MTAITHDAAHPAPPDRRIVVAAILALWFALAAAAVALGWLHNPPGRPPLPVLVAVAIPVGLFLSAFAAVPSVRAFVLGVDIRLLTALQGWRVAGMLFVALYAYDVLPAIFALPAGFGDAAVGVTAPIVVMALLRRPGFAASRAFAVWNGLGIFDFVVAVGTGTLASGAVPGLAFTPTTAAVTAWPLGLIPGFLVPMFTILHLAALLQLRARRGRRQ